MIDLIPQQSIQQLQSAISEKRYKHCEGVLETAFELSHAWKDYPVEPGLLAWAALFHDCAKELPLDTRERIIKQNEFDFGKELISNLKLSHAPLGAFLLETQYGMDHPDVLSAVAYHPTGHPDLTPIGWLVYIADYLEPGRTYIPNRDMLIEEASNDPLTGLRLITNLRISMVLQKGKKVHPLARKYQAYLEGIDSLCELQVETK